MKASPALPWLTAAVLLCSLPACQKKPAAQEGVPAPSPTPVPVKIVSAEASSFDAVAKHLNPGGGLYFYLSTENFLKAASQKLAEVVPTVMAAGKMDDASKAKAEAAWKSLSQFVSKSGVNEITGFGASSIALEPGYYQNKWMIHHKEGQGNGLIWKLHGSAPNALDFISYLPEKTAAATSGNLKLGPIWTALSQEAATNPDLKQGLDLLTQQFQQGAGLDLPALLASLGPNYSIVITLDETRMTNLPANPNGQPIAIPEPGLAIFIQVQDDLLINRLDQQLSATPMVTKTIEGEFQMRLVSMPLPMPFLRPVVAWKKGLLILSSNDALLREMIEVKAGKKQGLAADAGFKRLMSGLPASGCSFGYVSSSFQKTIHDVQLKAMQKDPGMTDPAVQKLMQYVYDYAQQTAACAVVEETSEGWISTSHGGTGPDKLVAACAVVPVALASAIAVPNFIRARLRSQATAVKQDLRMVDAACEQWAIENNKKSGDQPTTDDIKPYLKAGSSLYNLLASHPGATSFPSPIEGMGNIILPPVGTQPKVPKEAFLKLQTITDAAFWAPYQP